VSKSGFWTWNPCQVRGRLPHRSLGFAQAMPRLVFADQFRSLKEVSHAGVRGFVKQYASTLLEGLVIAMAFALVDRIRSGAVQTAMGAAAGLAVGLLLGLTIAERGDEHQAPD